MLFGLRFGFGIEFEQLQWKRPQCLRGLLPRKLVVFILILILILIVVIVFVLACSLVFLLVFFFLLNEPVQQRRAV
jgi:hypothetical protein